MSRRIHEKLGTAGFIIAIVALVAALGGGAYAASNGLNGKQKKEVEKIAKKYAGKPGTNGTNGTNGAPGAAGAAGAKGDAGTNGANGAKGDPGETGFTATLPKEETETGTWSAAIVPETEKILTFQVPIGFSIPLANSGKARFFTASQVSAAEFGFNNVTKVVCPVEPGEPNCVDTGCRWESENVEARPESTVPGTLCIFEQFGELGGELESGSVTLKIFAPGEPFSAGLYGPAGAYLSIQKTHTGPPAETVTGVGVWAVTAAS